MDKTHLFALSVDYVVYKYGTKQGDNDSVDMDGVPNISQMGTKA